MPDTIIGIMSGSSLDGLDMAACTIEEVNGKVKCEILDSITVPYSADLQEELKHAPLASGSELMKLDASFGKFIGHEVKTWMSGKSWRADYIASHGHTVFHEPVFGFTTQIGNGAHIAAGSGLPTITDFRSADVALEGQGAPFAPVADKNLFDGYDAFLNLGGIANVYLHTADDRWLGWDIGPCNQALNFLSMQAGHAYDSGGLIASKGAVLDAIRHDLIAMFPFRDGKPYSISNATVKSTWIDYLAARKEDPSDLLSTATHAIADMISLHINPLIKRPALVMVTGGGSHNDHLIELLRRAGTDFGLTYEKPSQVTIDHKESLLIAYLGYLMMHDQPMGVHEITGAKGNAIGGALYKAPK